MMCVLHDNACHKHNAMHGADKCAKKKKTTTHTPLDDEKGEMEKAELFQRLQYLNNHPLQMCWAESISQCITC